MTVRRIPARWVIPGVPMPQEAARLAEQAPGATQESQTGNSTSGTLPGPQNDAHEPTPGLDRLGTLHAVDLPRSTWGRPQYYGPPENYDTEADPPIARDRCLAILAEPGDVLPARCVRIHGHDGAHRSSLTHYSGHISGAIMPTEWSEG